jgi:hypothetical protein
MQSFSYQSGGFCINLATRLRGLIRDFGISLSGYALHASDHQPKWDRVAMGNAKPQRVDLRGVKCIPREPDFSLREVWIWQPFIFPVP